MSRSHVFETEEQAAARGRASPARQLAAALIDWVILLSEPVVVTAVTMSYTWTGGGPGGNWTPILYIITGAVPWLFVVTMVQLVMIWRKRRTLGQRLIGVRVVCLDGSRAGVLRALVLRSFGWIIGATIGSWSGVYVWAAWLGEPWHELEMLCGFLTSFFIAYGFCLFGDRRTLGDKIAGTMLLPVESSR